MAPICRYANSGEVNYRIADKDGAIAAVLAALSAFGEPLARYGFDGVRIEYADWWLNVRKSNTEPYLRLIVEARDASLLAERRQMLERVLAPFSAAEGADERVLKHA
jgi:phosphomannomutase